MDGFALNNTTPGVYSIQKKSLAGDQPTEINQEQSESLNAVYVTTGAPVPESYSCVVPIEETKMVEDSTKV
jgi:molybdopterin biosynthesis enzyme